MQEYSDKFQLLNFILYFISIIFTFYFPDNMLRLVVIGLLLASGMDGMIVRRQTHPDCPYELLPVLNVCPPCQPSGCQCADGKQLSLEDQRVAEEVGLHLS